MIAAGIAVGLGMTGNILAPIVFLLLFNIPSLLVKYYGTFLGYKLGSEYSYKSCKYRRSDHGWRYDNKHFTTK